MQTGNLTISNNNKSIEETEAESLEKENLYFWKK